MHIAGNPELLSAQQRELVALAARLGREKFAPRAAAHDRSATFPVENLVDLREAGLLGIAVPRSAGGLGADFTAVALVVAELGRHCGATALAFNMHAGVTLWAGLVADSLPMTPTQRAAHEACCRGLFSAVVEQGKVFSQPFSESGSAAAGAAPWSTLATPVAGGWRVSGRKIFATLCDAADLHAVSCTLDRPGAGTQDALLLAVPADAPGVSVDGDWDPLGMRATGSRSLVLADVFVPQAASLLPEGLAAIAAQQFPAMFTTLSSPYMGIAQAAYDFAVAYLRAELPGMPPVKRRMYPTKQVAVAEMRVKLEQTRALFLQNAREAAAAPDADARMRLYAAHYTVVENANDIARLAMRTCGGQALQKSLALERLYRDSRCGSLMLPWTAELCIDHLGRECLYGDGEGDEAIDE